MSRPPSATVLSPRRSSARPAAARGWHPGRRWLLAGAAVAGVGSLLPWLELAFGASLGGLQGAGLWTFYLAWLGLAGALVPSRTAALVQGTIAGLAAVTLPILQVLDVARRDLPGWQPGVGLLLTVCGGVLLLRGVVTLLRRSGAPA